MSPTSRKSTSATHKLSPATAPSGNWVQLLSPLDDDECHEALLRSAKATHRPAAKPIGEHCSHAAPLDRTPVSQASSSHGAEVGLSLSIGNECEGMSLELEAAPGPELESA